MRRDVCHDEVKRQCSSLKPPGADGFPAIYTINIGTCYSWDDNNSEECTIHSKTLFPKLQTWENVLSGTIILCNIRYNEISEVLVARLRPHEESHHPQSRELCPWEKYCWQYHGCSRVVTVVEELWWLQSFFRMRIDLSQAYDTLCWSYVEIAVELSCIVSLQTSSQIWRNGEVTESLKAGTGPDHVTRYHLICLSFAWKSCLLFKLLVQWILVNGKPMTLTKDTIIRKLQLNCTHSNQDITLTKDHHSKPYFQ